MYRRSPAFLNLILVSLLAACAAPAPDPTSSPEAAPAADLEGIQRYLTAKSSELIAASRDLRAAGDRYYNAAQAAGFDYPALWDSNPTEVRTALAEAKAAWMTASPLYEQMEGIVAGTPSLAEYDVILDAGASAEQDPENAAPYDLTLPDGRVLSRPGNLFGVLESCLWGTYPEFTSGIEADLDGDGSVDFGEKLPEAQVLKAGAEALEAYAGELGAAAADWEPTESDAFTALVVMVPTMSEYFNSWKNSRFIQGEASEQRDFVAISRLADIQDILGSLQVVYGEVKPRAASVDPAQATQIENSLAELKAFVAGVHQKEMDGYRYTPEEADLLGAEAQNRATAIAGQVAQVAARLNIPIEE